MLYEINSEKICKLIGIPCEIVNYINELDETTLKTLILIFSKGEIMSEIEIANALKIDINEAKMALEKLNEKGIILFPKKQSSVVEIGRSSILKITADELKQAKQNKNIDLLFKEAEKLYARPLNSIERRTLLYIFEFLNLQVDAILMALDFGMRNNKSLNQILKICENWSNNGIVTHEQAEKQIKILEKQKNIENQIKNCFGIYDRTLSTNEKNFIYKWTTKYGFKINMLKIAFDLCVDTIGKLSFQYIEKILYNWHKNNIVTPQDFQNSKLKKINFKKQKFNTQSHNLEEMLKNSKLIIQRELKHMEKI